MRDIILGLLLGALGFCSSVSGAYYLLRQMVKDQGITIKTFNIVDMGKNEKDQNEKES